MEKKIIIYLYPIEMVPSGKVNIDYGIDGGILYPLVNL